MLKNKIPKTLSDWLFALIGLFLFSGLVLTIVSWTKLCSSACSASHNWCIFGCSFEYFGLAFFVPIFILHWMSKNRPVLAYVTGLGIAGAIGAEIKFILLQKYQIGTWCPICLSIAACVMLAGVCVAIKYIIEVYALKQQANRGEFMKSIWKGISALSIGVLGFLIAVIGVSQMNPLQAQENTLKESLFFGEKTSPIEIYVFTDWACPACRAAEPEIVKMAPHIMKNAKLTFVDFAIHTETLNYSPYNVSFMIKDKPNYFKLRDELSKLSETNTAPSEEDIEKLAEKQGSKYQQLNFSDIALSQKYFKQLVKQFGVSKTPTMVIVNTENKKGKKLIGAEEITEENVQKAIEALKKK